MPNLQINLETKSSAKDVETLHYQLAEFNRAASSEDHYQPLNLIVRDESGAVVGGMLADTYWNWIAIEIFWLREDVRRQGLGSRMLKMAEEEAIRRGCQYAHLDTFDFQALGFYQKYGYTVFGQLDGLPPGHTRYYLRKTLT